LIVVNPSTRQFNIPGADLVFGVTADSGSVTKEFSCPRYVGNSLDLTACFIRMNYRNANGEIDSYLVEDVTVDGDNIVFGWELSPKVTMYKGNVSFVMCVTGPDTKVSWHTTLGRGQVLEGLEPDWESVMDETVDVVAQLVAMVEAQTKAVADKGAEWVRNVQSEGTDQIVAVQTAGRESREAAVAEIEAKGVNVRESIPEDYTSLENTVDGLVRGRAGAIICEAAGSAIAVNDASDMAMQGMRIFGRSTQDGTPTPEAPVEIVSVESPAVTVCGKNLLKVTATSRTENGVTATVNADGSIVCNGTATDTVGIVVSNKLQSSCLNNGSTYRLTGCPAGGSKNSYLLQVNGVWAADYGDGVTFVHQSNVVSVIINIMGGTVCNNLTFYPMITLPNTDAEWEPYSGQTLELTHTLPGIPVTSGGNYTDSDGQQWVCDEVDLERGVYVKRIGSVILDGSADEEWEATSAQYHISLLDKRNNRVQVDNALWCSHFKVPITIDNSQGFVTETYWQSGNRNVLFNYDNGVGGLDNFKVWLQSNPVTLQYMLNTPIETPLSETEIAAYRALHSNYPNTTVLNDAGAHMVVKYAADTKLYIDNKIKEALR
jgi:hypothetical protein